MDLTFFAEMDKGVFSLFPAIIVAHETDDFCGGKEWIATLTWGPFAVGVNWYR